MSLERPQSPNGPHPSPPERELVLGRRHLPDPPLSGLWPLPGPKSHVSHQTQVGGRVPPAGKAAPPQGPPGVSQVPRSWAGGGGGDGGGADLRRPRRLLPGPEVELSAPAGGGVWGGSGSVGLGAGLGFRRGGAAGAGPGGRGRAGAGLSQQESQNYVLCFVFVFPLPWGSKSFGGSPLRGGR